MVLDIIITLFLVFLNGFFVAAEFAIVKVRSSQIQMSKGKTVKIAMSVVNHLDAYLAATQLGITLASLGLGWVGEGVVSRIIMQMMESMGMEMDEVTAHSIALPFAFALITVLHIVFGELAPKSLAIRFPTPTTFFVAVPLTVFYFVFRPIIWTLNGIANIILSMMGIKPIHGSEIYSQEELKLIVAESEEGGGIRPSERSLIQNVFDFDDLIVRQVMLPRSKVAALNAEWSIDKIMEYVLREGYTRLPVYRDTLDNVIGMVYSKDLLKYITNGETIELLKILRPAFFVGIHARIIDLLREFQSKKLHFAVVKDDINQVAGIVTLEDILEELVGEIQDESDEEKPIFGKRSEDEFIIYAQNTVTDINKFLSVPLPDDESFTTLAKLLMQTQTASLKVNDSINFGEYACTILKINNKEPEIVLLKRLKEAHPEE
jgi:CBS domain containing-hemolysin-like protein